MIDEKGRVWVTSNVRPAENPDFCKAGSDSPFAEYFPLNTAGKHAAVYDPETKKFTAIDTCFNTHHLQFGYDKDNTLFFSGPGGQAFGWLNTRVFDETGDAKKAQGWCPAYLDTKGDGKIDPTVDKRIPVNGYGAIVNPADGSIWFATTNPTPGHLLRMTLGSNPPATCMAEESSSAGERGVLRLAMSASTKRVRRRSALDITSSRGRRAPERTKLQHLGIGDAHAHRRGGLPDRVAAQEAKFEDAAVVRGEPVEDPAHVDVTLGLGGTSSVAFIVELHQDGAVALAPDVGEHAPRGGAQVCVQPIRDHHQPSARRFADGPMHCGVVDWEPARAGHHRRAAI